MAQKEMLERAASLEFFSVNHEVPEINFKEFAELLKQYEGLLPGTEIKTYRRNGRIITNVFRYNKKVMKIITTSDYIK